MHPKPTAQPDRDETKKLPSDTSPMQCYKCNARGHKSVNCPNISCVVGNDTKHGTVDLIK